MTDRERWSVTSLASPELDHGLDVVAADAGLAMALLGTVPGYCVLESMVSASRWGQDRPWLATCLERIRG